LTEQRNSCLLISVSIAKKAFPDFGPPMMAESPEAAFDSPDWIFEIKLDGYRAVTVFDVTGKPLPLVKKSSGAVVADGPGSEINFVANNSGVQTGLQEFGKGAFSALIGMQRLPANRPVSTSP
jgi:hypothetical protein